MGEVPSPVKPKGTLPSELPQRIVGEFGQLEEDKPIVESEQKRLVRPLLAESRQVVKEALVAHLMGKISYKGRDNRTPAFLNFEAQKWIEEYDIIGSGYSRSEVNKMISCAIQEVMPENSNEVRVAKVLNTQRVEATVAHWREGETVRRFWWCPVVEFVRKDRVTSFRVRWDLVLVPFLWLLVCYYWELFGMYGTIRVGLRQMEKLVWGTLWRWAKQIAFTYVLYLVYRLRDRVRREVFLSEN